MHDIAHDYRHHWDLTSEGDKVSFPNQAKVSIASDWVPLLNDLVWMRAQRVDDLFEGVQMLACPQELRVAGDKGRWFGRARRSYRAADDTAGAVRR